MPRLADRSVVIKPVDPIIFQLVSAGRCISAPPLWISGFIEGQRDPLIWYSLTLPKETWFGPNHRTVKSPTLRLSMVELNCINSNHVHFVQWRPLSSTTPAIYNCVLTAWTCLFQPCLYFIVKVRIDFGHRKLSLYMKVPIDHRESVSKTVRLRMQAKWFMCIHRALRRAHYLICLIHSSKGDRCQTQIFPKKLTSSLKGIFTNINTERLTEILIALVLCFVGFLLARLVSKTFIRTIGTKLTPTNGWSGVVDIFLLYFPNFCDGQPQRSWF